MCRKREAKKEKDDERSYAHGRPPYVETGRSVCVVRVIVRQSISNAMPIVNWTDIINSFNSYQPIKTNLFVATSYGVTGNGSNDDTVAIQSALNAAGTNGGGIVYLPPGMYHLTNTLDVPDGVELLGSYEARHNSSAAADGIVKGAILQPYGGQGTTNGPPAIALEANAGLVGMTINYVSQNSNCIPYPPTIQGRGPNIYVIGVVCPDSYYYMDLDTYTCTNHLIDMVDCGGLKVGVHAGNGISRNVSGKPRLAAHAVGSGSTAEGFRDGAGLLRRRVRASLRGLAGMGRAGVPPAHHGLGAGALLRDHLGRDHPGAA